MSKVKLIISREYSSRVKKKSFLIMTILVPILAVLFIAGAIFVGMPVEKDLKVLIMDDSQLGLGGFMVNENYRNLEGKFDKNNSQYADPTKKQKYKFYVHNTKEGETFESVKNLFAKDENFDVMIHFNSGFMNNNVVKVHYKEPLINSAEKNITAIINNSIEYGKVMDNDSITISDYRAIKTRATVNYLDVFSDKEDTISSKAMIGLGFGIFIYMFIFLYGVQVMKGVIEEKSNRIIEVIVSSVKPFELMMGKIIGIMLVGLTQLAIWVTLIAVFSITLVPFLVPDQYDAAVQASGTGVEMQATAEVLDKLPTNTGVELADSELLMALVEIPWVSMIGLFIFYFIGGYLLYGALMAAIGAAVDSETDTQQFMLPVSMPLIFAYLISIFGIQNPNSAVINWCSEIPFTSPIVMLVRYAANGGEGMFWSVVLSMSLLIVTFILTTWIAAKIYRVGILMYGKKASYKELFKWLKY
ncbi:MAG: ABC-2 type transport system permease protein [Parvicella sp.]|jgi:ABC-2 type transport system permease protein